MTNECARLGPPAALAAALAVAPGAGLAQTASAGGERLDEVVVTASMIPTARRSVGAAVSTIGGDEVEQRGYFALADVMRTQPGIGVSNSGGAGKQTALRIRGEESYRTVLYIDGIKSVDPSTPQVAPDFATLLSGSDLERVEVLRGPQGFVYGADAGGVVNVLTRRGEGRLGGRLGIEHGRFGTTNLDASVSGGGERGDYFVSATDFETDGFNSRTDDTALMDADGGENTTLHAKLGLNATERLRLQLVARDVDATTMFDNCGFPRSDDCVGITEQTALRLSAAHSTDRFTNAFAYGTFDSVRDDFAGGASAFRTDGELSRAEYTGSFEATNSTTLVYGAELQDEDVVSGGDLLDRRQLGYYFEYQGELGSGFYLSAGARYDDNDDFGTHTSARVSGAYVRPLASGNTFKLRTSLGNGFRAPSLYEVAYNRGPFASPPAFGTALAEENSRGYDIGVDFDAQGGLHLELTYFDQEIENEIYFDLADFSGYLQSEGASHSTGVELAFDVPLGARFGLAGNYTYNDATDSDNIARLRRPRHLGNVSVRYASRDDRFRLLANYRLSKDSVDVGGVALDDYGIVDVSAAYAFGDLLEVYARIENATDESYTELVGFNTPGRAAYAGVRLSF